MKTKTRIFRLVVIGLLLMVSINMFAQNKESIAIVSMDTKGLEFDNITLANLMRIELEKVDTFEVLDKYDVSDVLQDNNIMAISCFGKAKLVKVGKLLNADKMLTGSAEKYGDKIIIILRLIDVHANKIEKANVMEYLDSEPEMQAMIRISINNLLGVENDKLIVDLLVNYDRPITSDRTKVRLNGPRMGVTYISGEASKRMMASKADGGYNMFPVSSFFGYQYEWQYLSSGDFQALVEVIASVNGLESGAVIPSLTFMNGFRFNKSGWEIGLGPVFRVVKSAEGYYDSDDKWHLESELPAGADYEITEAIDNRGDYKFSTGLIVAVGRTIHSGYLNIPINLYFSPRKEGSVVGLTFGFNIAKKPKLKG